MSTILCAPMSSTESLPDILNNPVLEFPISSQPGHRKEHRSRRKTPGRFRRTFSLLFRSRKENAGIIDPHRVMIVHPGNEDRNEHGGASTSSTLSRTSTLLRRSGTFSFNTKIEGSVTRPCSNKTISPPISTPILPATPPTLSTETVHFNRLAQALREHELGGIQAVSRRKDVRRFSSFSGFRGSRFQEPEWSFDVAWSEEVKETKHNAQTRSLRCRSIIVDGPEEEIELIY